MSLVGALLMILAGLAIMAFGLFLFYAWLPLLYGLIGLDIGLLMGRWLTGEVGAIAIILGIAGAIVLAVLSYTLEPYRRILLGVSGGFLLGLSLAAVLGLDYAMGGVFGIVLGAICALIGGFIVPRFFDTFVVVASSVSGAAMVLAGIHVLMPNLGLLTTTGGGLLARLFTVILALVGMGWQFSNIAKWQARRVPGAFANTSETTAPRPPSQ